MASLITSQHTAGLAIPSGVIIKRLLSAWEQATTGSAFRPKRADIEGADSDSVRTFC